MPALNVNFSEADMVKLREAADRRGQALRPAAHDMVLETARRDAVEAAALRVRRISTGLNRRLAEQ